MKIEAAAVPAVDARPCRGITAPVVQAPQFPFEVLGPHRGTDIQIDRLGVDPRRHGPVATSELAGHDSIEVHDPYGCSCDDCDQRAKPARDEEPPAPAA